VARLGAQLLMQAALEAEVTAFLGWDRSQRAAACPDARPGSRNGYQAKIGLTVMEDPATRVSEFAVAGARSRAATPDA
jgi:hypothetical protein